MSTALPKETVEAAINEIGNLDLKRWSRRLFHKSVEVTERGGKIVKRSIGSSHGNWYRHGSEHYANLCAKIPRGKIVPKPKEHSAVLGSDIAITAEDKARMWELNVKEKRSFREIEEIFHLSPQSGNDAQRCCREHAKLIRLGVASKRGMKIKPRMSKATFVSIAKNFLKRQRPQRAKAVFKEIEAILPNAPERRHRQMANA